MLKDFHCSVCALIMAPNYKQGQNLLIGGSLNLKMTINWDKGLPYNLHYTILQHIILYYTTIQPTPYYATKRNRAALYYLLLNSLKDAALSKTRVKSAVPSTLPVGYLN